MYPFIRTKKLQLFKLFSIKLVLLVLSLIPPFLYMLLINKVMIGGDLNILLWIVLAYIVIYCIQTFIVTLHKSIYNTIFTKISIEVKKNIISIFSKMDYEDYIKYNFGDIKERIEDDFSACEEFLNSHCIEFLYALLNVIVILFILIYMNYVLALMGFLMIPLSFCFSKIMGKKVHNISYKYRNVFGKYETYLYTTLQNWKEIKTNNLEIRISNYFMTFWNELSSLLLRKQIYWCINRTFIAFKDFFIVKMNLYFLGGILIINNYMSVGLLLAFMNYYEQLFDNVIILTESIVKLKDSEPLLIRIFNILNYPILKKEKVVIKNNEIILSNVFFSYDNNLVLDNVSLKIGHGHLAIVGQSGCGKSTFLKLIVGIYKPNRGKISIGGYKTSDITVESIGRMISIVVQNPILFNLSIRSNLLIAKKHASQKELDEACRKANIIDFIMELPEQYDTLIGENGIKLSGGQKQRLALARSFLRDTDIMIFDEATASLDHENEKKILDYLTQLSKKKTIITVSHGLSPVINADHIAVIDNKKIVAYGTHDELKDMNQYKYLFHTK